MDSKVDNTDSLVNVQFGAGCRLGISVGTDDAKPSDHFAQGPPSPTVSLV